MSVMRCDVAVPRSFRLLSVAPLAVVLTSCGQSGPTLHPASGKVMYNNQPAVGATVVFMPTGTSGGPTPSGVVGEDGTYRLSTHPHGEGAPAGEYNVAVSKFPENAREQANPRSLLPAKYADAAASGLKRTVAAGGGELPQIDLTGEPEKPGKGGKSGK
jgi:hypothetical protein